MASELPIRVLLVDDDPQMVRLWQSLIQGGFPDEVRIHAATDPKAARQCLDSEIVDLLITDLEMPGVSGLELLRCAKRRNAWTQVLLVTGHTRVEALTDAMELGASDYLLKPFDRDELKQMVTEVLSRLRRWRRALAGTLAAHPPTGWAEFYQALPAEFRMSPD